MSYIAHTCNERILKDNSKLEPIKRRKGAQAWGATDPNLSKPSGAFAANENRNQLLGILENLTEVENQHKKQRVMTPLEEKREKIIAQERDPSKLAQKGLKERLRILRLDPELRLEQERKALAAKRYFAPEVSPLGHRYIAENCEPDSLRSGALCPISCDYRDQTKSRHGTLQFERTRYLENVHMKWNQKVEHGEQVVRQRLETVFKNKKERFECLWLERIQASLAILHLGNKMLEQREWCRVQEMRRKAACQIQHKFRVGWFQKYKRKKIWRGFQAFSRVLARYVQWMRKERREKAAVVLLKFMADIEQANGCVKAIQQFRRKVCFLQRVWRRYLVWKEFIIEVRNQQFLDLESRTLVRYQKKLDKMRAVFRNSQKTKEEIGREAGGFDMYQEPESIRNNIRMQVIRADFKAKHRQHTVELIQYTQATEQYNEELRHAEIVDKGMASISGGVIDPEKSAVAKLVKPPRPGLTEELTAEELVALVKCAKELQKKENIRLGAQRIEREELELEEEVSAPVWR